MTTSQPTEEHDPDCCRMHASPGVVTHCCCKEDYDVIQHMTGQTYEK